MSVIPTAPQHYSRNEVSDMLCCPRLYSNVSTHQHCLQATCTEVHWNIVTTLQCHAKYITPITCVKCVCVCVSQHSNAPQHYSNYVLKCIGILSQHSNAPVTLLQLRVEVHWNIVTTLQCTCVCNVCVLCE